MDTCVHHRKNSPPKTHYGYGRRLRSLQRLSWPRQVNHLRCCSDADTDNKYLSHEKDASILSLPTIMGH
eukprot:scaffold11245_cov84-Skeletonema_dohrnii-CCMP3373.AAC.1